MSYGDIDTSRLETIHRGLEESDEFEVGAMMDDFGGAPIGGQPTIPAGDFYYEPATDELPDTDSGNIGRSDIQTAEGAEADAAEFDLDLASFNAKRLDGLFPATSGQIMTHDGLDDDALEQFALKSRRRSDFKVDALWVTSATDPNFNNENQPSFAWDDNANSPTPLDDLEDMAEGTINGETAVMGTQASRWLKQTAQFREVLSNDQTITQDAVITTITGYVDEIDQVIILDMYYDTSPKGMPSNIGKLFEDYVWVGHESDFIRIEPNHRDNPLIDSEWHLREQKVDFLHSRRVDWVRPNTVLGEFMKVDTTS